MPAILKQSKQNGKKLNGYQNRCYMLMRRICQAVHCLLCFAQCIMVQVFWVNKKQQASSPATAIALSLSKAEY